MSNAILPDKLPRSTFSRSSVKAARPSFAERRELLSFAELNELIHILTIANRETPNEKILVAIRKLNRVKDRARDQELIWEQQEFQEFLANIDDYPHSVRTWMLYYRDKELE